MNVVELTESDIEAITRLEQAVCIPPIQASKETILARFEQGNRMLGIRSQNGELISSLAFRYAWFSPLQPKAFPRSFDEYCLPTHNNTPLNAVFVYSFNVSVDARKKKKGFRIVREMSAAIISRAKSNHCEFLVGDGRLSSYNGSSEYPQESIAQCGALKQAVDKAINNQGSLTKEEVMLEPTLKVYSRFLKGFTPLWLVRDFFPADTPAGGYRIIFYCELK